MDAVIDEISIGNSSPLTPEQHAQLACWGGEEAAQRAILVARIEVDASVAPQQLCAAVEQAVQQHELLGAAICPVPGFRGLRLHAGVGVRTAPVSWCEAGSSEEAETIAVTPLSLERGELLRAVFVAAEGEGTGLLLASSALAVDVGSLAALAVQIEDCLRGTSSPEIFQYEQYRQWCSELEADADAAAAAHDYWAQYRQNLETLSVPKLAYRRDGDHSPQKKRLRVRRQLNTSVLERVDRLAENAGTTAEILLQTAWWLLLARLTGNSHYAAGWQHDCRQDYDLMQGAVGVFEKILPLAIEGSEDESFAQWLDRMAARTAGHIDAQEYCPLDLPEPNGQLTVGFAYRDTPRLAGDTGLTTIELPGPMPIFELALAVEIQGDGAWVYLHANRALYPQLAIERLLEQYITLLQGALETPHSPAADLPWIGKEEWETLRNGWAGPEIDPGPRSIGGHIARWARKTPDAPAVVCGDISLSYRELDSRASRLAHWMLTQGVEAGALVALEMPRSAELVVAILATWRTGAAYLPLEPEWPRARRESVIADASPALILNALPDTLDTFPASHPGHRPREEDPAYVLYTSGSTGHPKGVMIGQRQLLNYVVAASDEMNLTVCRRWGLVTSIATDLGNTALFGALFNGASLALASAREARDAAAFERFVARHRLDALKVVPSHLEALLESDSPQLPGTLVLGGEATPRSLIERLRQLAPACTIYNHYGPTETTVGVMLHRLDCDEPAPEVLPLSRVLANNRIYLLDKTLRPVPTGAQGELYIAGAQLCHGYLGRGYLKGIADSAFVDVPWDGGRRLYRTGDLAWALPHGVRLAGRADHQLKIRGYRVEPAEVETALLSLPTVRQTAVISRNLNTHNLNSGAELVAFIATDGDSEKLPWQEQLAALLPTHMLPAEMITVDELPRLPSGKIDRQALATRAAESLAAVSKTTSIQGSPTTEPTSALEAALSGFMAALLGREQLAADADFFESGGHSLLVIRLVARIRKVFQLEVEPGLVFDCATPRTLAQALSNVADADNVADAATLEQLAEAHREQF